MKTLSKIMSLVVALALLMGMSTVAFAQDAGGTRSVVVALAENNSVLDPLNGNSMPFLITMECCFDGLVYSNHDGTFRPALATSWEFNEEGTSCTFRLREGVTFHNGAPFDADDVMGVYTRLIENKNTLTVAASNWATLDSIEKVDDFTVRINTSEPFAPFLGSVSQTYIYSNAAYEQYGDSLWNDQYMYGTGPWAWESYVDGQYVSYTKNENYWGKADYDSHYDHLTIRYILEPSTAIAGQLAGDIDAYLAAGGINSDMLSLYTGYDNIEFAHAENAGYQYFGFNCPEDSVFSDYNVRLAFMLAIDFDAIGQSIYGGYAHDAAGILNSGALGYDESLVPHGYDPERAKELLANSSYDGRVIELSSHTSTLNAEAAMLACADYLEQVGFKCSVKIVENAVLTQMRTSADYDVYMVTVMHVNGDPYGILTPRVMLDTMGSRYANPDLNALIAQSNATLDVEARSALLRQAGQIIYDEIAPHGMFLQLTGVHAINKGVVGLSIYPDAQLACKWVDFDPEAAAK